MKPMALRMMSRCSHLHGHSLQMFAKPSIAASLRACQLLALSAVLAGCAGGHSFMQGITDPQDGKIDISDWLVERKGVLPVPIVITEPAVGNGGGVALMFLRNSMRESAEKSKETGQLVPPDIWVVGGGATENGTKALALGGMKTFDDGRWRYRGGVARADVNLQFYGIGSTGLGGGAGSLGYSLDGTMSSQQILRRIGESSNWVGVKWVYLDLNGKADLSKDPRSGLRPDQVARRVSGLGLTLEHDSRDSIFTPSRGWSGALDATFYDPGLGSDTSFQAYRAHVFSYWPLGKSLVLGARVDGRTVSGRAPFFMLPFIDLRGIPAGRYMDKNTAVAEMELRWEFVPRWAAIGFVGAGKAWGRDSSFSQASSAVSKGVGVRYEIARKLGLWIGLDYARGPEGGVTYLQVGTAWR
jgi:hypothetical protein